MSDLTVQGLVDRMQKAFLPEKAAGVDMKVLIELQGEEGGSWVVTIRNQTCKVVQGVIDDPDLTMRGDSKTVLDIFSGKQDGVRAYMQGRLRLVGDMALAMKLAGLFKLD